MLQVLWHPTNPAPPFLHMHADIGIQGTFDKTHNQTSCSRYSEPRLQKFPNLGSAAAKRSAAFNAIGSDTQNVALAPPFPAHIIDAASCSSQKAGQSQCTSCLLYKRLRLSQAAMMLCLCKKASGVHSNVGDNIHCKGSYPLVC